MPIINSDLSILNQPDDEFVTDDCSEQCRCFMGGNLECIEYGSCHRNAQCTVQNDIRDCYCSAGYTGDGLHCEGKKHMCGM